MSKKQSTYRHEIQTLLNEIWNNYDKAGVLRDCAIEHETDFFNQVRGKLYDAAIALGGLDNTLSKGRATMEI